MVVRWLSLAGASLLLSLAVGGGATAGRPDTAPDGAVESVETVSMIVAGDLKFGFASVPEDSQASFSFRFEDGRRFETKFAFKEGTLYTGVVKQIATEFRAAGFEVETLAEVGALRIYVPNLRESGDSVPLGFSVIHSHVTRPVKAAALDPARK